MTASTMSGLATTAGPGGVVLRLRGGTMAFGDQVVWSGLDLDIAAGEFVAVVGANGAGKTTLLKTILGLTPLTSGELLIGGRPPRRGSDLIGYIPQERRLDPPAPIRPRDLVRMGIDGNRYGPGQPGRTRRGRRQQVDDILGAVGADRFADTPIGLLSGGEQQRVRIAQALSTRPVVLACDEPLLSLDLTHQRQVVALIDGQRRRHHTAVLFVTHEINPVLPYTDRVLYLAGGGHRVGPVDQVMTSQSLSALYGSPVQVIDTGDQIVVAGTPPPAGGQHTDDDPDPTTHTGGEAL